MTVKIILENSFIAKVSELIPSDFFLQHHHLKAQKISIMYTAVKIESKSVVNI